MPERYPSDGDNWTHLRQHEPTEPLNMRHTARGAVYDREKIPDPNYTGSYEKIGRDILKPVGDQVGWGHWLGAEIRSDRSLPRDNRFGAWSQACASVIWNQQVNALATMIRPSQELLPKNLVSNEIVIQSHADTVRHMRGRAPLVRERVYPLWPEGDPILKRIPDGMPGVTLTTTYPDEQIDVFLPSAFAALVSDHRSMTKDLFSSVVYDINGTELSLRHLSRLSNAVRVAMPPNASFGKEPGLALLGTRSPSGAGFATFWFNGSSAPAAPPVIPEKIYTGEPKQEPPPEQAPISQREIAAKAPIGGVGVYAPFSWEKGGPFHPGVGIRDKHKHGVDADGAPWSAGHIDTQSLFFMDADRDGPLDFEEQEHPRTAGGTGFAYLVHLRYHTTSRHSWQGGDYEGKFRWHVRVPIRVPFTPQVPPPDDTPPTDKVPPPETGKPPKKQPPKKKKKPPETGDPPGGPGDPGPPGPPDVVEPPPPAVPKKKKRGPETGDPEKKPPRHDILPGQLPRDPKLPEWRGPEFTPKRTDILPGGEGWGPIGPQIPHPGAPALPNPGAQGAAGRVARTISQQTVGDGPVVRNEDVNGSTPAIGVAAASSAPGAARAKRQPASAVVLPQAWVPVVDNPESILGDFYAGQQAALQTSPQRPQDVRTALDGSNPVLPATVPYELATPSILGMAVPMLSLTPSWQRFGRDDDVGGSDAAPLTGHFQAFGKEKTAGGWAYTNRPGFMGGQGPYIAGTAIGGFLFAPPEVNLDDRNPWRTATTGAEKVSTTTLLIHPAAALAFGSWSSSRGSLISGGKFTKVGTNEINLAFLDDEAAAVADAKFRIASIVSLAPINITGGAVIAPVAGDIAIDSGASNVLRFYNGSSWLTANTSSGDVVGPSSAVADSLPMYNSTSGKLIKDGKLMMGTSSIGAGVTPDTQTLKPVPAASHGVILILEAQPAVGANTDGAGISLKAGAATGSGIPGTGELFTAGAAVAVNVGQPSATTTVKGKLNVDEATTLDSTLEVAAKTTVTIAAVAAPTLEQGQDAATGPWEKTIPFELTTDGTTALQTIIDIAEIASSSVTISYTIQVIRSDALRHDCAAGWASYSHDGATLALVADTQPHNTGGGHANVAWVASGTNMRLQITPGGASVYRVRGFARVAHTTNAA